MRILGTDLLHPLPGIGHEVAKAPIFFIIGIQKKSEIMTAESIKAPAVGRQVALPHGGRQQRAGIVIGAVAMDAIGDGVVGMLQDAGIVGKGFQVIQLDLRELELRDGLDVFDIGMPGDAGFGCGFAALH
jgi:hypothetical protein